MLTITYNQDRPLQSVSNSRNLNIIPPPSITIAAARHGFSAQARTTGLSALAHLADKEGEVTLKDFQLNAE